MVFDFPALVDGLKRNNVGFGGLWLQAELELKDGKATFPETGQSLPFEGEGPGGRAVRQVDVRDAATPSKTRLLPRAGRSGRS